LSSFRGENLQKEWREFFPLKYLKDLALRGKIMPFLGLFGNSNPLGIPDFFLDGKSLGEIR
jgi:hypothetical protein